MANGRVAYFGPTHDAVPYFSRLNFKCPAYSNPSDYFIRQLSIVPHARAQSQRQSKALLDSWACSPERRALEHDMFHVDAQAQLRRNAARRAVVEYGSAAMQLQPLGLYAASDQQSASDFEFDDNAANSSASSGSFTKNHQSRYTQSASVQFQTLIRRAFLVISRDPTLTRAKALQSIVLSLVVGLIYFRLANNQKSIQNVSGALFFILINQSFGSLFGILNSFAAEIPIFRREHSASMYSTSMYYLAKTLAELPFQLLFPALFTTIAYFMIGLHNDSPVVWLQVVLVVMLCAQCATSLGLVIATLASSIQVALAISPLILLPFLLFGGFFVNTDSIPVYFRWLSQLSFFKYGFASLSIVVWRDFDIGCDDAAGDEVCRTRTGDAVLRDLGIASSELGFNIGILFALIGGFRLLSFWFLLRRARTRM